jgi:hypothetical protein
MSLSDLSNIGSFVSGVGVLISIIYLAVQVRRAEKYQRALMQQGRAARVADLFMRMAEPGLASAMVKGQAGDANLSPVEVQQLLFVVRTLFLSFEDSFLQQRAGLFDKDAVDSGNRAIKSILGVPAYRAMWTIVNSAFPPAFVAYVAKIDAELPGVGLSDDLLSRYRAALTEARAPSA